MATDLAAIVPPPPGRFSTTTWPSVAESGCAISRAITSAGPPGGNGTIRRIGRLG